ncbi:MAG: SDR family oxidoreductase [Gemmatimonadaceae bacterium]|nr:SDR family oxidoreductase [Gemmatimonadaceae bacterium]
MPTSAAPRVDPAPPVLLTGATGYIGGRLLRVLEEAGHRVRCLTRRPEALRDRVAAATEIVEGDVLDRDSLRGRMDGVRTAFYMVHSMGSRGDFVEQDRRGARNFGEEAGLAGVKRIIYLGGLGEGSEQLSPHLRSRLEVADILRESGGQVLEFRASIVIGSGSLSFEMIRSLVERLPLMVTPKWVDVTAQPIAIEDLLQYLSAALDLEGEEHEVFEIGGPESVSYGDLMREYARQRQLRRLRVPVPFLTPGLSSLWLGLVTPVFARVGRKLIDSIRHPTVVRGDGALRAFPHIRPLGFREAIAGALRNEDREWAQTRWSDSLAAGGEARDWGGVRFGNRLVDSRTVRVDHPPAAAFRPVRRIGGTTGWYFGTWLWNLRGLLDLAAGGVGMRRGRRDPDTLAAGDVLDCWRVEMLEPNRRLRLLAEMKLPGRAWLEFVVEGDETTSTIRQTAIFDPAGLLGLAYWYAVWPLHRLVFSGMLAGIADAIPRLEAEGKPEAPDPLRA